MEKITTEDAKEPKFKAPAAPPRQHDLWNVPSNDLEDQIGFGLRHRPRVEAHHYLMNFLAVARQFGHATTDDSWGELEKRLEIMVTQHVRDRRALMALCAFGGHTLSDLHDAGEQWFTLSNRFKAIGEMLAGQRYG